MKIGWGTGITIFYSCFVVALLLVLKKSKEFDHSLVVEDYYKQDINYQTHYDKIANSKALVNPLEVVVDRKQGLVNVNFPKGIEDVQGTVLFFRASDRSQDFLVPIKPNQNNQQIIPTEELSSGLWTLKINWFGGTTAFYDEEKIVL